MEFRSPGCCAHSPGEVAAVAEHGDQAHAARVVHVGADHGQVRLCATPPHAPRRVVHDVLHLLQQGSFGVGCRLFGCWGWFGGEVTKLVGIPSM